ncbi:MAG: hypothetical protein GVY10_09555 [Verrucomicrobia bacterium]|jgi:hypothetical protein|nr:hypothetical protein [Verrucomicrobiota bacterium]
MARNDSSPSDLPPHLEAWLHSQPLQADRKMAASVLRKIREEDAERRFEETLDGWMRPLPHLYVPSLAEQVRENVRNASRTAPAPFWFRWGPPVAAAATLLVAFIGFRMDAPSTATLPPPAENSLVGSVPVEDENLTRIFALASNLQSEVDVSKVRSDEALAFLME